MKKEKNENLMKMDVKPMTTDVKPMKQGLLSQIFHLYYDGFRTMTLGKTLGPSSSSSLPSSSWCSSSFSFRIILTVMQKTETRQASFPRKF